MKCACYECGKSVKEGVTKHFISKDGRILCKKCSVGVSVISYTNLVKLIELEKAGK